MPVNPVFVGFGATGSSGNSLKKEIKSKLRSVGFRTLTPSFYNHEDMTPKVIEKLVIDLIRISDSYGSTASLRFLSVNASRDFSWNSHYGKMK